MTDKQRITLMADWWPNAARTQGWKPTDRTKRMQVLSLAVTFTFTSVLEFREALASYDTLRAMPASEHRPRFRHLESASALNHTSDVDAVKTLLLMLADSVRGADEHGKPERGTGRRHMNVLDEKILCLSQYPLDKPMGMAGAHAFVQTLIDYKFNFGRVDKMTLDDIDDRPRVLPNKKTGELEERPSQKEQLMMTVNARLNGKHGFRARASHSMHDMLTGVGLPCACRACITAANAGAFAHAMAGIPPIPSPLRLERGEGQGEVSNLNPVHVPVAADGEGDPDVPF